MIYAVTLVALVGLLAIWVFHLSEAKYLKLLKEHIDSIEHNAKSNENLTEMLDQYNKLAIEILEKAKNNNLPPEEIEHTLATLKSMDELYISKWIKK